MANVIWATSAEKRHEFEDNFTSLVNNYVDTYEGGQPIISWNSDKIYPVIHQDFFNHLPRDVQERIKFLIERLKD